MIRAIFLSTQIFVGVLIIVLNTLTLVVFRKGKLSNSTYHLLTHCAVINILFGFSYTGLIIALLEGDNTHLVCRFTFSACSFCVCMCICTVLVMSIHYYMIMKNIHQQNPGLTNRQTYIAMAALWVVCLVLLVPCSMLLDFENGFTDDCLPISTHWNMIVHCCLSVVVLIIWILLVVFGSLSVYWVRHHLRMISSDSNSSSVANKHRITAFLHILRVIISATIIFTICVLPGVFYMSFGMVFPQYMPEDRYVPVYLLAMVPIDSLVNVFALYFNRGSEFKTSLCKMIKCAGN